MTFTEFEIVTSYRQAAHQGKQIKVLAELNDVDVDKIVNILEAHGEKVDRRTIPKSRKPKALSPADPIAEDIPVVETEIAPEPEEVHEPESIPELAAAPPPDALGPVLTLGHLRRLCTDMGDDVVITSGAARFVGLRFVSAYEVDNDRICQTLELLTK